MVKILSNVQATVSNVANRVKTSTQTQLSSAAKKISAFVSAILTACSSLKSSVVNGLTLAGRKIVALTHKAPVVKKEETVVEAVKVEEVVVIDPRIEAARIRNLEEGFDETTVMPNASEDFQKVVAIAKAHPSFVSGIVGATIAVAGIVGGNKLNSLTSELSADFNPISLHF